MIRVCPSRDAICPHGNNCPYVIDRYNCDRQSEAEDLTADFLRRKKERAYPHILRAYEQEKK